jgi:hypothetical protein
VSIFSFDTGVLFFQSNHLSFENIKNQVINKTTKTKITNNLKKIFFKILKEILLIIYYYLKNKTLTNFNSNKIKCKFFDNFIKISINRQIYTYFLIKFK